MKTVPILLMAVLVLACEPSGEKKEHVNDEIENYVPSDLREEIEKLKRNVGSVPTNVENVNDRIEILWAWANAMAVRDGGLRFAPNLTKVVSSIRGTLSDVDYLADSLSERSHLESKKMQLEVDNRSEVYFREMDNYIRELALREEEPAAFGKLVSSTTGPFKAHSFQTIRQTWKVGTRSVGPGGYLLLGKHFMADQGEYQTTDSTADNYVTVSSDNAEVEFKAGSAPLKGMHGGWRRAKPMLAFVISGGTLRKGDTVTITYGDSGNGSRGFRIQSASNDYYQLPVYISFNGDHESQYMLDLVAFKVKGNTAVGVNGFAPSVVPTHEPFNLTIRSEDKFRNKATERVPAYTVKRDGRTVGHVEANGGGVQKVEVSIGEPGFHYFVIESDDGAIRGESNPVWAMDEPKKQLYWGETHGHSGLADGQGSPESYFRFARDEAGLDFATLSEHDIWLDDGEWERIRRAVKQFDEPGHFITYMGYEWTVDKFRGGHRNVIFRNTDTAERHPAQEYGVPEELYKGLREMYQIEDILVIPQAHEPAYWAVGDDALENLVEIHSLHGYFEWFGRQYLEANRQVGFIAASDDHLGHPGYNTPRPAGFVHGSGLGAVWAERKTSDAIFDSMKSRHVYATTSDRIILDVRFNGMTMGSLVEPAKSMKISGQVMGTDEINELAIVKNNEAIHKRRYRDTATINRESQRVDVTFFSTSRPVDMVPDNPRGYRLWYGYLDVENAEVLEVSTSWENPHFPRTRRDPKKPNRIRFATKTRGERERLHLRLKGASRETRITIHLKKHREQPTGSVSLRQPQVIPATEVDFSFDELERGRSTRRLKVDKYVDTVGVSLVVKKAPRHQTFEFIDSTGNKAGDTYYVRVEQANSEVAWSSPVFVDDPNN